MSNNLNVGNVISFDYNGKPRQGEIVLSAVDKNYVKVTMGDVTKTFNVNGMSNIKVSNGNG